MKECPKCERVSSDTAERCDCGYDFRGGALDSKNRAKRLIREVVKGIAGITAVVWFLAPITRFHGLVVFAVSTVVLLICGLLIGALRE